MPRHENVIVLGNSGTGKTRTALALGLAAATRPAYLARRQRGLRRKAPQPAPDHARHNAGCLRYCGDAAVARGTCFRRRQQASGSLVELLGYCSEALTDLLLIDHPGTL